MSHHLTAGELALLETALTQRQQQLDRQLDAHQEGLSRAEHAHDLLEGDAHETALHEADREVDLALSDRELQEIGDVSAALRRLHAGSYGRCADCGAAIPFQRLQAEPWALRCVACEGAHERAPRPAA